MPVSTSLFPENPMNDSDPNGEALSAWIDGERAPEGAPTSVEALLQSPQADERWALYHWVGDTLREGPSAAGPARTDFVRAVMSGLTRDDADRTTSSLAGAPFDAEGAASGVRTLPRARGEDRAANDATFRWRAVAGVACLVAIGTVVWHLSSVDPTPQGPVLAGVEAGGTRVEGSVSAAPLTAATMIRDPRLDELIAQHRQAAGVSAFQNGSGFLRAATYEGPRR